jgi:tetratricopeptide (TPR) repeat protein
MKHNHRRVEARQRGPVQAASPTIQAVFTIAVQHHLAGRLNQGEHLYRQVLALNPRHADGLHLLGVVAYQTGRLDHAIELIRKAIASNAKVAAYHCNLGNALRDRGELDDADTCYRTALKLQPNLAEAHTNLGSVLTELGRLEQAIDCHRRALAVNPNLPEAHTNLGRVLQQQRRLDQAVVSYRTALALRPDHPQAHCNLGSALEDQGQMEDAAIAYRTALDLKPDFPEAHYNLGNVLRIQGRLDQAVTCFRHAVSHRPNFPEAHNNLGQVLNEPGELDQAIASYRSALDLKPDFPEAHNNLGKALGEQGQLDKAVACYRAALALRPDFPDAHHNLALVLLARGDMAAGWQEYEWRWKTPHTIDHHRAFVQPRWRGEAADGKTLLIHAEQGFGDTVQFCRYASLAAARGLRVIMQVPKPLVRLLHGLQGVDLVVANGDDPPAFDLHCPMLSLPLALGTTITTIPSAVPYLHVDPAQAAAWQARLAAMAGQGPRIGLVWAGDPGKSPGQAARDRRRSIAPDRLAPLFETPGLQFFSLQKDGPLPPGNVPITDFMDEMDDFADTAALIANLDLVISVDTAVAHMAAALGKPVWVLYGFEPDWRWLGGQSDSPWYPALRLYRQTNPGDWDGVLAEVARDLPASYKTHPKHVPTATGT